MDERILAAARRDGIDRRIRDIFVACFDQVVDRQITTVAELKAYLAPLGWHPRLETVYSRCHRLIREMYWGLFARLNDETHPELWKTLTVTNRDLPKYPDLKRDVLVPNLYVGLLDIHNYTDFCQRNRDNVSMLRILDDVIETDMRAIADKNGCLSSRTGGDMIIIVGESADSTLRACLGVIDCFSRKRLIKAAAISETRTGKSFLMDDFHVAGGVAGGQHYSSLIITAAGDISGPVVNTAARLQSFAGTVAPQSSKLMTTSHVHQRLKRERPTGGSLTFFDCGKVEFKGTAVRVHELLFGERETKKIRYQEAFSKLEQAATKGGWTDDLIPLAVKLLVAVLQVNPVSRVKIDGGGQSYSNAAIVGLCEEAIRLYEDKSSHRNVSTILLTVIALLESARSFDRLVLLHVRQIVEAYDRMTREFEALTVERILDNQKSLFSAKERAAIDHASKLEVIRDSLIERGRSNHNIYSTSLIWNKIVTEFGAEWEHRIYSGKR